MNVISITGHVGRDPETTTLPSGTKATSFSVAENEVYTTDAGRQEHTNWFQIKCFGRLAEIAEAHLTKGKRVGIVGKLRYEEWESEGQKRSAVKIVAQRLEFLSPKVSEDPTEPF
jgi:single-strand DNA-binding protein